MHLPRYAIQARTDWMVIEFISVGPKGSIIKRIEFSYVEPLSFWNLGFGDYNPATNQINDQIVSDNGDGRKVLATVAFVLQQFLTVYPDATVFFTGSNEQRTRVYDWAITKYWDKLVGNFLVEAVTESGNIVSMPTTENLVGFLVTKRQ